MIKSTFQSLTHLFYPHLCIGCGSDLLAPKALLCLTCVTELPHTGFETYPHNPIERIFYGRLVLQYAHAGFYFSKGTLIQTLIHDFKYKGNKAVGILLSKIMAEKMMNSDRFKHIDYLIPLPLFADKEYKRGFNQAKIICDGISEVMNIPVLAHTVLRKYATTTQTKKHRTERWQNVAESFTVQHTQQLQHKHILLVDDVITTGATIEACTQQMAGLAGIKISVATLATATN